MIKLLRAGARRYLKSYLFWATFVITIIAAVLCGYTARKVYFEEIFVIGEMLLFAITISWLIGRESGEGIFRNKIIIGHTKEKIFISELILGVSFVGLMFLIFLAIFLAFNEYLFYVLPTGVLLKFGLDFFIINIVFAMIVVTINCLFSHRTIVMVVSILLVLTTTYAAINLRTDLKQEEYHITYDTELLTMVDENGKTYTDVVRIEGSERKIPNRDYVKEPKRTVYTIIYNILPYGHITEQLDVLGKYFSPQNLYYGNSQLAVVDISDVEKNELNINLIYDFALIFVVGAIGYWGFRKKDIK